MKNETISKIVNKSKELAKKGMDEGEKFVKIFCSLSSEEQNELLEKSQETLNPDQKEIESIIDEISDVAFRRYLVQIAYKYESATVNKLSDDDHPNVYDIYKIDKIAIDKNENYIDKLKNTYNVLSGEKCTLGLLIHRKKDQCDIYAFVRNNSGSDCSKKATLSDSLKKSFRGNFPGTTIRIQEQLNISDIIGEPTCVNIISNIASEKSEKFQSQSIEKLIDGCIPQYDGTDPDNNDEYVFVLMAESVTQSDIEGEKEKYSNYYTALSPYVTYQQNCTYSEALNIMRGINAGVNFGASFGMNASEGKTKAKTEGITLSRTMYNVKNTLDYVEKQIKRLENSKALGLWKFAGYVFSKNPAMAKNVANMYRALTQGDESEIESVAINFYSKKDVEGKDNNDFINILDSINQLEHPVFKIKNDNTVISSLKEITPTTFITGTEIAYSLSLPRKSVQGLSVIECTPFGRNVVSMDTDTEKNDMDKINIGKIYHMYEPEGTNIELYKDKLSSHTFVTGSTGSGKSNTVFGLIEKAVVAKYDKDDENNPIGVKELKEDVHFLVIEPAKGEYRDKLGGWPGVMVYGTNPQKSKLLKINPFSFPKNVLVYEHIDRLVEIFNACWPMYAAMPAILKDAVIRAYESVGWNITTSQNDVNSKIFPTFKDVMREIKNVLKESEYSADNKGDYVGALVTRIKSLTNGINGLIFGNGGIQDADLFDENVIVDLSSVGSSETKSLIMGFLMIKLQEYRMSKGKPDNSNLLHLTVLEEAHNLLKRTSVEQSSESSNMIGKSVEMLANSIAELRAYGEGFVIADQSPGLLDMSVIRNTNTKIIHRLPDMSDRELVGKAAALNDEQIKELAKLPLGVAAIYQNDWISPVLGKVNEFKVGKACGIESENVIGSEVNLKEIVDCILKEKNILTDEEILELRISSFVKCELIRFNHSKKTLTDKSHALYAVATESKSFEKINKMKSVEKIEEVMSSVLNDISKNLNEKNKRIVTALILRGQAEMETETFHLYKTYIDKKRSNGRGNEVC